MHTIITPPVVQAPVLDHDAMMLKRFNSVVNGRGRRERRIVANLCEHVLANGFRHYIVYDGEEEVEVSTTKEAMELIFNLDEVSLRFVAKDSENPEDDWHGVLLILGNDMDIIADWNYSKGDADGFNATMDAFDVERFA